MTLAAEVLSCMAGKTLATAESCTGGGIGAVLTAVPGASAVYKGGVISYWSDIKRSLLGVPEELLYRLGPVSAPVAEAMAEGARRALNTDVAVSVTGLAGPAGDEFGNPVGRVYVGYCDEKGAVSREFTFPGSREEVRNRAARAVLELILEQVGRCGMEKRILTPLGEIQVYIDGVRSEYEYAWNHCDVPSVKEKPLAGSYRIMVSKKDWQTVHCVVAPVDAEIPNDGASGERYLYSEFVKDNVVLTIGAGDDHEAFDTQRLRYGVGYVRKKPVETVMFGVAWATDHQGQFDIRTQLATDLY